VRAALPPSYVNAPVPIAYAEADDALIVTMIRILGLCWAYDYERTPALTPEQVATLTGRARSTLYRHLKELRERPWIRVDQTGRRIIIRPVTDQSLSADPLRVLRGFRFALDLGFELHRDFFKYARDVSFKKVAAERIGYELIRIMACRDSFPQIRKMNDLGIFRQIFPEAKKIIEDPFLWGHSLETFKSITDRPLS